MTMITTPSFETIKPEHLFNISNIITHFKSWKTAMDEIVRQLRKIFIFDNIVVYSLNQKSDILEISYAKAVGRGRSAETDIAWGEDIANQIVYGKRQVVSLPGDDENDRLRRPYLLGVPLTIRHRITGALVIIRFGGPKYCDEDEKLIRFIANQVALLGETQQLAERDHELETRHQMVQLQEDFISNISHELRTPLGFIKGYTTTLLRKDARWKTATREEFLQIIEQETDNLQRLIDNLLDSARLQSGQFTINYQPVRLDSVLADVITRAKLYSPSLKIRFELAPGTTTIEADPFRIAQIFENLVSNSIKYAPGADIFIQIEQNETDTKIQYQDHGPGITEDALPFIFDRFFRGQDQTITSHGSGLGLFICKQIIMAHSGTIQASSKLGEGLAFIICLPNHPPRLNNTALTEGGPE